jgi:hypothetical protein
LKRACIPGKLILINLLAGYRTLGCSIANQEAKAAAQADPLTGGRLVKLCLKAKKF